MSVCPIRRSLLRHCTGLVALPLVAMPYNSQSTPVLPPELRTALPDARLIGSTVLRFFGLRVYEARLWAGAGFEAEHYSRHPMALELKYERKLDGASIAERSIAEMRRVDTFSETKARQWLELMKQAFPDVIPEDRLLGLNDGRGEVRFFHNTQLTATIQDPLYARLFFGIWLAPQTSAPALRQSLLGLSG